LFLMGVRDGDKDAVRQGAGGAALFHFSLQHLQQKGYKNAWLGWSRPMFRDGVLEFKRRWSQVIVDCRYWGFGLRVCSLTPAVMSFLRNNPFIFKRDDKLYAAVCVNADEALPAELLQQMAKEYIHAGLAGLEIYRLPPQQGAAADVPPGDLPERVRILAWPGPA
jgi:hypothetical protein